MKPLRLVRQKPHQRITSKTRRMWWHGDHWHWPGHIRDRVTGEWRLSVTVNDVLEEHYCARRVGALTYRNTALFKFLSGKVLP